MFFKSCGFLVKFRGFYYTFRVLLRTLEPEIFGWDCHAQALAERLEMAVNKVEGTYSGQLTNPWYVGL